EADAGGLLEQCGGDPAGDDPRGRLAGARALEDRSGLLVAVLEHPREVGVAGARAGQRTVAGDLALVAGARVDQQVLARDRIDAHHLLPLRPLGVRDLDRERRAEGEPMAETAVDRQHVLLELLTAAAAVAEPAPGER